jgi:glycosyltransferase involved in cell wall biosynthesis
MIEPSTAEPVSGMVDFTIVIPVYYNEGCLIPAFQDLVEQVFTKHQEKTYEIIYINDGSKDRSMDELLQIQKGNPDVVRIIDLTRNFGQTNALMAGFSHVRGKCVIAMSADGQDPPSIINDMLSAHFDEGYDVVIGTRAGRDESYYRVITSRIFYAVIKKMIFSEMPTGGFDFTLMSKRALQVFMRNSKAHFFYQGQILWMGFKTKFIEYYRNARIAGQSRWTFAKKVTYLIDGILAFSFIPIRFMSLAGIALACLGFLYAIIVFFNKLIFGNPIQGWTPLMIVVLVLGGFQSLILGIIGEYVWRTMAQVQNRDMYVINHVYEKKEMVDD